MSGKDSCLEVSPKRKEIIRNRDSLNVSARHLERLHHSDVVSDWDLATEAGISRRLRLDVTLI